MKPAATRTFRPKRWVVAPPRDDAAELAKRMNTAPLVAQVLLNRGVADEQGGREFLRPSLHLLHAPESLPGAAAAAQRIVRAARDGRSIVIYGDYDVDGITGAAILFHALRTLGVDARIYIPHRVDEGYGLNAEAVGKLADEGASLLVSVDCGVTASAPAAVAAQRGVELIITDHHELHRDAEGAAVLPDCAAIVHPRLPGTAYPNPHLCGAGVAFKLAWAIGQAASGGGRVQDEFKRFLVDALALAALGTIADVVPLVGENRILAAFGLGGLRGSQVTGLRALIASAGLDGKALDSYDVGFMLAPRLNACGRMGHAALAVELLTRADEARAGEIAAFLEQQNRRRQTEERRILEHALRLADDAGALSGDARAIVLGSDTWHAGVIGIVASRLVDRFHLPAVLVAFGDAVGQGSGRSIPGFHLAQALAACAPHLESSGGHEMAAGLKVRPDRFAAFRERFGEVARERIADAQLVPELHIDAQAELQHFTEALVSDLQRLGPFGHGNRKPLLCCRNVELASAPRRVGRTGDHLQLLIRQGGRAMKCIAFNAGALADRLRPGTFIDLAVQPQVNEFQGRRSVELEVRDVLLPPA